MINRKSLVLIFLITSLLILFGTIQSAAAQPVISLVNPVTEIPLPGTTLNGQVRIIVDDSENTDFTESGSGIQVIDVTVSSGVESIVIPLTETGDDTGIFKNVALFFTKETLKEFPLGETATIIQHENNPEFGFENNNFIDTILVDVFTVPDPNDITTARSFIFGFPLTETGPNTADFRGQLLLTSGPTTENSIEAASGDLLNVAYNGEGLWALIIPNPNDGVQVLRTAFSCSESVPVCDTFTVSYADAEDASLDIVPGEGGGGSGGGLLRPGFVLDILGGTSGGDFAAPQLTIPKLNLSSLPLVGDILDFILNANPFTPITPLDDPSIDYPLSINGNGYLLTQFTNTIETYTGKTGEPVSFKMTLFDATGIEHIALYTNLRGDAREIEDSDTFVIYNEDEPLEITDPNGFFSTVNFTESEYNGKYIANFNMTFAKPMDTSDVIIRTWDELLNSGDVKILEAIKIEGEPIVNPNTNNLIIPDAAEIVIPYYKMPYYEIPNPDSKGNLIYYNSFGGLEEKQVQPYHTPTDYPDYIGRADRHFDLFKTYQEDQKLLSLETAKQKYGSKIYVSFEFSDLVDGMYPYVNRMNNILKERMVIENQRALESFR